MACRESHCSLCFKEIEDDWSNQNLILHAKIGFQKPMGERIDNPQKDFCSFKCFTNYLQSMHDTVVDHPTKCSRCRKPFSDSTFLASVSLSCIVFREGKAKGKNFRNLHFCGMDCVLEYFKEKLL